MWSPYLGDDGKKDDRRLENLKVHKILKKPTTFEGFAAVGGRQGEQLIVERAMKRLRASVVIADNLGPWAAARSVDKPLHSWR